MAEKMATKELLKQQLKEAMASKNTIQKNVVTLLRAAILQYEKDTKEEITEEGIAAIAAKQLKQRKDSLESFEKAGRQDLVETTQKEISLLGEYIPQQLTDDQLRQEIEAIINETGASSAKDLGIVMKAATQQLKGVADGKRINGLAKELLGS
ncbi:MAG: GatB/YqeY domain-containing protein [Eubacteriaceae bacterium]|jgi:uncharacterized protein YqeY|nr:GatB/YqeY domain-containing protein [Eubacteriaceae bacterium]